MTNGNGRSDDDELMPAMSAAQFAAYIERRLSIEDSLEVLGRDGMQLRVRVDGSERSANLSSFYSAYSHDPSQLDLVVQNLVGVLLGRLPSRNISSFADLADRIYPMIKPIELLATVRERNVPMLAYREFLSELIITYVIDEQKSVAYISEAHLERWDLGIQELHARAIENLRRRTYETVNYVVSGEGEQRIFIYSSGDGYDASRLLLSDMLARWEHELPGNLLIGIPNRDFLIGFSDANPDIVQRIALQIQNDAAGREHGITDQLFLLDSGQVREYDWE